MSKYKFLASFGCSFTMGGGLNDERYHRYLNNDYDPESKYDHEKMTYWMTAHSYPAYLARLMQCNFKNFGIGCGSNAYILKSAYEFCNSLTPEQCQETLVTVQTSILSRILLYSADEQMEHTVNSDIHPNPIIAEYYKQYIQHFYDTDWEYKNLLRNVDLLQTWLRSKNIDYVFIGWNGDNKPLPEEYFYKFPGYDGTLSVFTYDRKLLISDLKDIPYQDHHLTQYGNELVAEELYKHIKDQHEKFTAI